MWICTARNARHENGLYGYYFDRNDRPIKLFDTKQIQVLKISVVLQIKTNKSTAQQRYKHSIAIATTPFKTLQTHNRRNAVGLELLVKANHTNPHGTSYST